jgi:para-aminobenzoate synthetase/4-amino-4-deoxychorismate lyase
MTDLLPLPASGGTAECFALLDDSGATSAEPRSRLYSGYAGTLSCKEAAQLPTLLEQMQEALRKRLHAVGLFSYELGAQLHAVASRTGDAADAQVQLFERCELLSGGQVSAWLARNDARSPSGNADIQPAGVAAVHATIGEAEFTDAIARIRAYIEAGDVYQVNYTYRLRFDAFGTLCALYRRLRERQPVPFGALIALPDGGAVLSLSPELFVRHERDELVACPMKGTAAASGHAQVDNGRAQALAADPKNRAENLMIVDLLRNDLGRIAQCGTVTVPALFEVRRYGEVLQMTSTVRASPRGDATLAEIFGALYPCGSITGAPKRRAVQIIRELEPDARGLYTGAIGWFDAPAVGKSIGDFCLSVPIRTLVLQPPRPDGIRTGVLGIGAGIVHDSDAASEYAECRLKAGFLTGLSNDFELFETMHATRRADCRHLDRHLRRLLASAAYFGFACDESGLRQAAREACAKLATDGAHRLRLALNQQGGVTLQTAPLSSLAGPVRVLLAAQSTDAGDLFLRHKTTVRNRYDAAWRAAEAQGAFDTLFFNARGELTEGARTNVFVKLDECWYTPPLACGLLPGVMRAVLLDDPAWQVSERRLTLQDLRAAQEVVVCNALRGALPAIVDWSVRGGD